MKQRNRKERAAVAPSTLDRLKRVWCNGDTYETLGEKLGLARSSVNGYYHRNPELHITHPVDVRRPIERNEPVIKQFSQRAARIEAIKTVRSNISAYTGPRGAYTLVTLPQNGCKWPYGNEPEHMTFCGHKRADGERAYCTEHARMAYAPRSDAQRNKRAAGVN